MYDFISQGAPMSTKNPSGLDFWDSSRSLERWMCEQSMSSQRIFFRFTEEVWYRYQRRRKETLHTAFTKIMTWIYVRNVSIKNCWNHMSIKLCCASKLSIHSPSYRWAPTGTGDSGSSGWTRVHWSGGGGRGGRATRRWMEKTVNAGVEASVVRYGGKQVRAEKTNHSGAYERWKRKYFAN